MTVFSLCYCFYVIKWIACQIYCHGLLKQVFWYYFFFFFTFCFNRFSKSIIILAMIIIRLATVVEGYSVGWGWRIHRLHLCRGVTPTPNECRVYNTKRSDGEAPVMREHWGMRSTPSLPLLLGPLWLGMVTPYRALSMG